MYCYFFSVIELKQLELVYYLEALLLVTLLQFVFFPQFVFFLLFSRLQIDTKGAAHTDAKIKLLPCCAVLCCAVLCLSCFLCTMVRCSFRVVSMYCVFIFHWLYLAIWSFAVYHNRMMVRKVPLWGKVQFSCSSVLALNLWKQIGNLNHYLSGVFWRRHYLKCWDNGPGNYT